MTALRGECVAVTLDLDAKVAVNPHSARRLQQAPRFDIWGDLHAYA